MIKETVHETHGWPDGVVIRELVSKGRRSPVVEFIYCNDLPALKAAFRLPGRAGLVWLLVAHRSRATKRAWITLPQPMLSEWGIDKSAKSRALGALQAAGYIDMSRSDGCSSRVRLVRKSGSSNPTQELAL